MKKVIKYQCEYCNKLFARPDRHKCKYDPSFKNCLTCEHNMGYKKLEEQNPVAKGNINVLYMQCYVDGIIASSDLSKYDNKCVSYKFCGSRWIMNKHNYNRLDDGYAE